MNWIALLAVYVVGFCGGYLVGIHRARKKWQHEIHEATEKLRRSSETLKRAEDADKHRSSGGTGGRAQPAGIKPTQ